MRFVSGRAAGAVQRGGGRRNRSGFTLIEIMVVIVVIAIIAALVAPNVFKNVGEARITSARAQMSTIASALDMYRIDNGKYPSTESGLAALREPPTAEVARNWKGPYMKKDIPLDPWGEAYVYVFPGEFNQGGYDLYSLGADNEVGGEGENADILEWESGGL